MGKVNDIEVLLVEDDDFTRLTLKEALLGNSFKAVHDFPSVDLALSFAKKNNLEVAVLDFNLGRGPNGVDLAHALRRIHPEVGIILLTAFIDPSHVNSILASLPAGGKYLAKNDLVSIDKLIEAIKVVAPS